MSCRPGHSPRHPDFATGNQVALVHGAESSRSIEAKAEQVRTVLLDVAPWLDEPEYAPAVARFLRAEARALMLHDHITNVSAEQGTEAVPTRMWEQATAADRLAAQLGNTLGLDPSGKARLASLAAGTEATVQSLVQIAEQGQAIAERRMAALDVEAKP